MQLVNRKNLAVHFAAATEESRYSLRAVLVTEQETVATDGHILARVSNPTECEPQHFPMVDGFKANGFTRGLIPVDACKEIEKAIPKKTTIPVLAHAAVSSEIVDEKQVIKVAVTDLATPKVFTVNPAVGQFPNWDVIWPDTKPVTDICFDAGLLKRIATAAERFSDRDTSPIRLRFYGPGSALRFDVVNSDGQEMNGLVMPTRETVVPKFKETKAATA